MKNLYFFLLFSTLCTVCSLSAQSQVPDIEWQKSLGGDTTDQAYSVSKTFDGGYIVAGYSVSNNGDISGNHGNYDAWVVKISSSGVLEWQKSIGGSSIDGAYALVQTSDSGYVLAGTTASNNGDVTGNHGLNDYWVVKLSSSGSIQWQKCYGGTDEDIATSIRQTNDGGFVIAGYSSSTDGDVTGNHGGMDYWVVKTDATGTLRLMVAILLSVPADLEMERLLEIMVVTIYGW
jgi:hypothetical protein